MSQAQIIEAPDAELKYWPNSLSSDLRHQYFQTLLSETPWQQDDISLFGRTLPIPRLQAWYGDDGLSYQYSGIRLDPLSWSPTLLEIKRQVESICGQSFNSVLLNLYRDGRDSNGWHSDDEPELGTEPVIASLSLGATRRFRLRHKTSKETSPITLHLEPGSLLLMSGKTQTHWQHSLPKTSTTVEPRINLTFRKIINHG